MESQPFFMRTPQMYIKNNLFNDIPFVITCAFENIVMINTSTD